MRDHEAAMQVYVKLAVISDRVQQSQVCDRFLLLAAVEACRAGWPQVAARCRQRLVARNPSHLAHRHVTISDALRDAEFQQLVVRWERYCPFEKAEAMLRQLDPPLEPQPHASIGERMLVLLADPDQSESEPAE